MCSTPAPPSTPLVAASIWSGTGEVKTSPAQAASSMPEPDEAAVQRLVARTRRRRSGRPCPDRARRPEDDLVLVVDPQLRVGGLDAAAAPRTTTSAGSLISFFMVWLLCLVGYAGGRSTEPASARSACERSTASTSAVGALDEAPVGQSGQRRRPAARRQVDGQLLPLHGAAGELLDEHRAEGAGRVDRGAGGRRDRDDRGEDDEADGDARRTRRGPCGGSRRRS